MSLPISNLLIYLNYIIILLAIRLYTFLISMAGLLARPDDWDYEINTIIIDWKDPYLIALLRVTLRQVNVLLRRTYKDIQ